MERPSLTVEQFFKEHAASLQMKLLADACDLKRLIREPTVNRPGLALSGFTRYFAYKRMQTIGHAESFFLESRTPAQLAKSYAALFKFKIPCLVFSRNLHPDKQLLQL